MIYAGYGNYFQTFLRLVSCSFSETKKKETKLKMKRT